VSKNDNCDCAGTTKVAVKLESHRKERLERKTLRRPPSKKQTERVRTWHVGADCSKYRQLQQGSDSEEAERRRLRATISTMHCSWVGIFKSRYRYSKISRYRYFFQPL